LLLEDADATEAAEPRRSVGPPKIGAVATAKRRASVWGLWRGTASRGGADGTLDGGPGLRGAGREEGGDGDGAEAFLGFHGWEAELGKWSSHSHGDYWRDSSRSKGNGGDVGTGRKPRLTVGFTNLGSKLGGDTNTVVTRGGGGGGGWNKPGGWGGGGGKGVVRGARGSVVGLYKFANPVAP
jgi:hypothetical protein